MLTNWLINRGLTRDSRLWVTSKICAFAFLVASGSFNLVDTSKWLGFQMSDVWAHRVTAICVAVLFISGRYDKSPLPGGKKTGETE